MKITEKTLRRIIREELLRKHTQQLNEWGGNPLIKSPDKIADQVEAGDRDADEALATLVKRQKSQRYMAFQDQLSRGIDRIRAFKEKQAVSGDTGLPSGDAVEKVVAGTPTAKSLAKKDNMAKDTGISVDTNKGSLSSELQLQTQQHMVNIVGLDPEKDRYAIKKILGCSSSRRCPDGEFGRRSAALWNAIQSKPDYKIKNVSSPLGELNGWRKSGKWQEAWAGLGNVDKSYLTKLGDRARAAVKKSDDKKKSLGKGEGTPAEKVKKATKKLVTDISALAKAINTEFNTGAWASVDMTGTEGFKYLKNYYKKRILKTAASLLTARDTFLGMPDRATLEALQVAVDDFEEDVGKDLDNMMGIITKLPASPSVNSALDAARSPGTTLDQLRRALTDYRKGNV